MRLLEKISHFEGFEADWRRLMIQGVSILFAGCFMALASALNPGAVVLAAREFSWLPVSGIFILALGILECIDAFFAKHQRDFTQNLQVGVFDFVVGGLIIFSVSGTVSRLSMLIAAFLIVRGMVRIGFVYSLDLPNKYSTALGGLVSVILGILIFQQWPTDQGWFVSLCLNIEIAFRGWAGISFALWIKKQKKKQKQSE